MLSVLNEKTVLTKLKDPKQFVDYAGKQIAKTEKESQYKNEISELKIKEKALIKELSELRVKISIKQREKRRFSDRLRKQDKKDKNDGNST
jgi:hypothetical protein